MSLSSALSAAIPGRLNAAVSGVLAVQAPVFRAADLFSAGQDGAWYDFSKTDRLWQLSTGITAVATAGNPIGMAIEGHEPAWGSLTLTQFAALQSDLVTNGSFSADANWTKGAGWTISGGKATHASGSSSSLTQPLVATANKLYRLGGTISGRTASSVSPQLTGGATTSGVNQTTNGSMLQHLLRGGVNSTTLGFLAGATWDGSLDDISLRLIPGNHATQATAGSRPTWQTTGARGDGTSANLLTVLNAGSGANCLVAVVTVPVTLATTQVVVGTQGSSNGRLWLGIDTSGRVCGGVGTQSESTIVGTSDLRGSTVCIGLSADGTTVRLFAGTSQEYSGAQSGSPNTTVPFRLLALNNNGTAANWFAGDAAHIVAGRQALTAAQYAGISRGLLPEPVVLAAWMSVLAQQTGRVPDRIVDPFTGSDSNDGSINRPWRTLEPLRLAIEALPNNGNLTAFCRAATYTDQSLDAWNTNAPIYVRVAFESGGARIVWTNPAVFSHPTRSTLNGWQIGDNPGSFAWLWANGLSIEGFSTGTGNTFGTYGVRHTIYGPVYGDNGVDGFTTHGSGTITVTGPGLVKGMNKACIDNVGTGGVTVTNMAFEGHPTASAGIIRFNDTTTGTFTDCTFDAAYDLQPFIPARCTFVRGRIGTAEKRVFIPAAGQVGLVISPETVVYAVYG